MSQKAISRDLEKILASLGYSQNIRLGMIYGSRRKERDIDLFLLFDNVQVSKNLILGNFDLSQADYKEFAYRLENFDVEYTEPILTGDLILGELQLLEGIKKFLSEKKPSKENLDYLSKRSLETYTQAKIKLSEGKYELFMNDIQKQKKPEEICSDLIKNKQVEFYVPAAIKSLSILSYALSYLTFKQRYERGESMITLKKILESPKSKIEEELINLRDYTKSRDNQSKLISLGSAENYFNKTEQFLGGNI